VERERGVTASGRLRPSAWRETAAVLRESETIKAAALAAAYVLAIGLGVLFTIAAARIPGDSYGALARLSSFYLILNVPGLALQAAVAREVAVGDLGGPAELAASLRGWFRALAVALVAFTVASVLLRFQLASLLNVEQEWVAASTVPTAILWLGMSMQRGTLQGLRAYTPVGISIVGEGLGRLVVGIALAAAGGGVAGAWIGQPVTVIAVILVLAWELRRRLEPVHEDAPGERLRDLVRMAWVPIAALTLMALLQYADVIVSGHVFSKHPASAYAAASVAAKVPYWVALGIALYLLPEATRRSAVGERPLDVLGRSLGLLALAAVPALVVFAVASEPVLRIGFGAKLTGAAGALPVLCLAYSTLAAAYLAVQYLLALRQVAFLGILAVAAGLEIALLSEIGVSLTGFAGLVLAAQGAGAVLLLAMAWRAQPHGAGNPEAVVP
jgi:O-antigen/teichoic acid export membrane protein